MDAVGDDVVAGETDGCGADAISRAVCCVSNGCGDGAGVNPTAACNWAHRMAQEESIGAGYVGALCPAQQGIVARMGQAAGAADSCMAQCDAAASPAGIAHPSRAMPRKVTARSRLM